MKAYESTQFAKQIEKHKTRDPALYKELQEKISRPRELVAKTVPNMMDVDLPVSELETPQESRTLETIVRPNARPVLLIRNNRATTEFLGPESQVWADRVLAAQNVLDRVIPAVGRVEVNNHPDFTWVGTGWLVADDIIVTNRHVAREFGRHDENGFIFRPGTNGGPMSSQIDFLEEYQNLASLEYAVRSILWIAQSDEPDMALLRVAWAAGDRRLPPPVVLTETIDVDEFVATIGYPANDSRVPDQNLVQQIFGNVFDKKRLAPGQVMEIRNDEIEHDCSTLGGNSGSLLVNLRNGEAVGLHFAGTFLEANYAVAAPKIREMLGRVQRGELPGAATIRAGDQTRLATPGLPQQLAPGVYTFQLQIPIEITVKVGSAILPGVAAPITGGGVVSTNIYENAVRAARETLDGNPDVIDIRLGYRFKRGWITDERVIVVEVREKLTVAALQAASKMVIPPQILGVGVDVRTAAFVTQLEQFHIDIRELEAPARPGLYREPTDLTLDPVKERMKAIFHVSPDSGFPNLKAFLGRVKHHLTSTMYEWEPNHISDAIANAMTRRGNSLRMVTQRRGTEAAVNDMKSRIGDKFKHVWASVGSRKLIPSAYHIKVASRDGEEFWLSSGNWKDSNQANIDPAGDHSTLITPLRNHNREWHVIIENAKLAVMFQKYIEFDFQESERVPLEEGIESVLPDIFVPEAAFMEGQERAVTARYFPPLIMDRELEIQPLLTPDRDAHANRVFMSHAIKLIKKGTQKIYVQNQSFNLTEDNNDAFQNFMGVLKDKQRMGVDVRIIFRDAREFGPGSGLNQQELIERIKDFGLNTDFIRLQKRCHTKGIIVDTTEVLLGSHNLTNTGSLFNRDASLLVRDPEVASYFEQIFLFDWDILARQEADELVGGVRVAQPGEETPMGFRRVSLAELRGES